MRRVSVGVFVAVALAGGAARGAAPAPPSYQGVTAVIQNVRDEWAKPGARPQPNAPGWNTLFGILEQDLRAYDSAQTGDDRLVALGRVYRVSQALATVGWAPARLLRESLREWLRPRVRLAWAGRRLTDAVKALPPAPGPDVQNNREKWISFVKIDLGEALREYEGAATVAKRAEALDKVHRALDALGDRNRAFVWNPARELEAALNDLYNRPNLDVSVDVYTLSPLFNVNLVTSGPVYRKGYVSQVTAGPKTGFGLMPSDNGIAFYNSQLLSSYTPIWDFQQQVASDPQGQRAARMYQFSMATTDQQELTVVSVIGTNGLALYPSFKHNVNMLVGAAPQPGGGLMRGVASLIGFSKDRIVQEVREGAFPRVQANVVQEAMEQALENTSAEAAQRNATFRQYLIGGNRVAFQNVLIENLSLRSRPENALISGLIQYLGGEGQRGADARQPGSLLVPDPGISADVHLPSVLSNFATGFLQSPEASGVENLLIETQKVEPGSPLGSGVKFTRNADYPAFLEAISTAQAANDPKVLAVRVKRPSVPPDFAADAKGNLVVLIRDLEVEVPAPARKEGQANLPGPPAKAYRVTSPLAEVSVSFRVEPTAPGGPLQFKGKVEDFDLGTAGKIIALNDDESKGQQINRLLANVILGLVRARVQGQAIDLPLSNLPLQGFAVQRVSPLDPTGWVRARLVRTGYGPIATTAGGF